MSDLHLNETPSQTAGPYVHIGCTPATAGMGLSDLGTAMIVGPVSGEIITIRGAIFDGLGAPIMDAIVEIWQADSAGLFNTPHETRGRAEANFTGWGRSPIDEDTGLFTFHTLKPGSVPTPDGRMQAPHISVWIVARGINIGLQTRLYFPEDEAGHVADPVLSRIEHRSRVPTLIATREADSTYRFDIHLQGPSETVFFDI